MGDDRSPYKAAHEAGIIGDVHKNTIRGDGNAEMELKTVVMDSGELRSELIVRIHGFSETVVVVGMSESAWKLMSVYAGKRYLETRRYNQIVGEVETVLDIESEG